MKISKLFKIIQFRKVSMLTFSSKYITTDNKINHSDFICDDCKKQEYSLIEDIYLHISFKGYCEDCYKRITERKRFIKNE